MILTLEDLIHISHLKISLDGGVCCLVFLKQEASNLRDSLKTKFSMLGFEGDGNTGNSTEQI